MINYPFLAEQPSSRETVDVFRGYNHNLRIGDGEFYDMENLSGDHYPVLSPRKRRGAVCTGWNINAAVHIPGRGLFYTDDGVLVTPNGAIDFYQPGEQHKQQLVLMGSHLILAPEMMWLNTDFSKGEYEYGSANAAWETESEQVTFELCREDGSAYEDVILSGTQPENPENGALWLDTSSSPNSLKQYSASLDQWASVVSTYIRISAKSLDIRSLKKYDGVTISGIQNEKLQDLNASTVIWGRGQGDHTNYIVVPGILDETVVQDCGAEGKIRIERTAPRMDFVVEAGNRLWGCRYGLANNGQFVNEIYASKLGDFKNWSCFMGISTDSWVGSVGSQGPFTGAANIGGYPVFYKENVKHKVWISESGAHQIVSTPCKGVKSGCDRSIAPINGAVIYKSQRGFCVDDGSLPEEFGDCFAGAVYEDAVGCVHMNKYYVSMRDPEWRRHLFVYDLDKKLWHREDGFHAVDMCSDGRASLYAVDALTNQIVDLMGAEGEPEAGSVKWMAEMGPLGLSSPDAKYISRLTLRLSMEVGAELTVYAQYDREPEWVPLGSVRGVNLRSFSLPVRPRRCDNMRLRLEGEGDVRLYAITKTIEEGSELP